MIPKTERAEETNLLAVGRKMRVGTQTQAGKGCSGSTGGTWLAEPYMGIPKKEQNTLINNNLRLLLSHLYPKFYWLILLSIIFILSGEDPQSPILVLSMPKLTYFPFPRIVNRQTSFG